MGWQLCRHPRWAHLADPATGEEAFLDSVYEEFAAPDPCTLAGVFRETLIPAMQELHIAAKEAEWAALEWLAAPD